MEIGHNRVARLMREEGANGAPRKRWKSRSKPANSLHNARTPLGRRFQMDALPRAWVGDITYLWTKEGWLYLSVLLGIHSKRVAGWAADSRMRTRLCSRSLEAAMVLRQPADCLVHHSDRGSQYTRGDYFDQLSETGPLPSLSRAGDCRANAVAESLFGTPKTTLIHRKTWAEAETANRDCINRFHNPVRQHSANDTLSRIEAERRFHNNLQRNAA
jgi:putative transposase